MQLNAPETSLAAMMKSKLRATFPYLAIEYFDTADPFAVIVPVHPDWDPIELIDDETEITVEFGKFTHTHILGDLSGGLTVAVMDYICDHAINMLRSTFNHEKEFYIHKRGGGARSRGSGPDYEDERVFLWSSGEQHPKLREPV